MELHDPGFVMFNAEVRQDQSLDEAKDAFVKTLDDAAGASPDHEGGGRAGARARILKNVDLMLNSADRVGLNLSEYIGQGDWRLFFLNRDRVRKATLEDVQKVATAYLKPSNRTLGVFLPTAKPDRAEVPPPVLAADVVKDYKGDAAIAAGEAFDPSPANIESRTKRSQLPGGLKMALLPKKTRGGTVVASMTLRFGDEKSLFDKATASDIAADMLMRGTTKHTRQQTQGRARPPEGARRDLGPADPGERLDRDDPRQPPRGPEARRRDAARAVVPGRRSSRSCSRRTSPTSSSSRASRTRSARTSSSAT